MFCHFLLERPWVDIDTRTLASHGPSSRPAKREAAYVFFLFVFGARCYRVFTGFHRRRASPLGGLSLEKRNESYSVGKAVGVGSFFCYWFLLLCVCVCVCFVFFAIVVGMWVVDSPLPWGGRGPIKPNKSGSKSAKKPRKRATAL